MAGCDHQRINVAVTRLIRLAMLAATMPGLATTAATGWLVVPSAAVVAADRTEHARATIHWEGVPLGEAVARLADVLKADVMVDRRVDPSQRVSLAVRDASMDEILSQLAAARSLGVSQLGGLLYLGPRDAAGQLRTLAALRREDVAQLPADDRAVFLREQSLAWPRLAEPRELVAGLVGEQGWQIRRAELIPHDLWPAGRLPELTLIDRLTVVLAGFDLTFHVLPRERAVEIARVQQPVRLSRRYRWPAGSKADMALLQQQLPDGQVRATGRSLQVDGRLEDHERLTEILQSRTARRETAGRRRETKQVFTLHVEDQPAGAVLRQLGRQLGWTIEVDEAAIGAAGLSLDRRVSLAVEGVELDKLLDALLAPVGLDYERDQGRLRVFPRRAGG